MTPEDERIERWAFFEFVLIATDHDCASIDWFFMQRLWHRCTEEMRESMRDRERMLYPQMNFQHAHH